MLVLDEFARDRFDEATARWYYHQRQALAAAGRDGAAVPRSFRDWWRQWRQEHADIHPYETMRVELDRRFTERFFAWTPYLHGYRLDDELEPLERKLIDSGAIQATGFRYVGERTVQG